MKISRTLMCAVALAAIYLQGSAFAADMPVKAPPMAAAYNWSGFYAGGNVGYGWSTNSDPRMTFVDNSGGLTAFIASGGIVPLTANPKGVVGGAQVGYNWQSADIVYGLVTDFQGSAMRAKASYVALGGGVSTLARKMDDFGTVRGRLGVARQNWLFYGTGGLAYGHIKENLTFNLANGTAGTGSSSQTKAGWTAGVGLEYGISRWSIGLEYLYIDLGRTAVTEAIAPAPIDFVTMSSRNTSNIVRGLVNYRF